MKIPYVFKKCNKCGEWLVASTKYFRKNKNCKYGLYSQCKKCDKEYREKNKDKIAKYQKKNKDKIAKYQKEYKKEYYEKNKDEITKQQKEYQKKNKDKIAEQRKEYYEKNKDKIVEYIKEWNATPQGQTSKFNSHCKRRTKKQNQGNEITKEQWLEMMKFFGFRCAYSGKVLSKDTRSIDHIIALNDGGVNEIWNCVPMYKPYNCSKQDKNMLEWYEQQEFYSKERLAKIYEWQEYAYKKYTK